MWAGIWSGPDGLQGPSGDRPGEAWYSQVTPMTDFPVMNNNQHAMPLLAALRVAGVEATAAGLTLTPRAPSDFALRTELVDLSRRGKTITGAYRPVKGGSARALVVDAGAPIASASLNGAAVMVPMGATTVTLAAPGGAESSFVVGLQ